jgi:hypothetical protein
MSKEVPPKMWESINRLEEYMRGYFRTTFERARPIETVEDALNAVSVLERARVYIEYPDHEFCQDQARKLFVWEQLQEWYRAAW